MRGGFACGAEAGDLAFNKSLIETADAGEFAGTVDMRDGSLLGRVDGDGVVGDAAAEKAWEFEIGNEMEAAGEVVAGDLAVRAANGNEDGAKLLVAVRAHDPGTGAMGGEGAAVREGFGELAGTPDQLQAKADEARERGLLKDAGDKGTLFTQVRGDGEQKRTAAGEHDAFAGDGQAGFDEGLQTAGAEDAGQCPAGKGQEQFARAGGKDEAFVVDVVVFCFGFDTDGVGRGSEDDARAGLDADVRVTQASGQT